MVWNRGGIIIEYFEREKIKILIELELEKLIHHTRDCSTKEDLEIVLDNLKNIQIGIDDNDY